MRESDRKKGELEQNYDQLLHEHATTQLKMESRNPIIRGDWYRTPGSTPSIESTRVNSSFYSSSIKFYVHSQQALQMRS